MDIFQVALYFDIIPVLSSEKICEFPSETGPCKAAFPRWFYDVKTGKCSQFIYGGCDGNKNNFETQEECENKCDSKNTASKSSRFHRNGIKTIVLYNKNLSSKSYQLIVFSSHVIN